MSPLTSLQQTVIVIGAGPAGLFAAKELANNGVRVVLVNRDIKPGGLAEYGIFVDKHKMKSGLRKQFGKILAHPNITYLGNITIGQNGHITLDEMRALGADAVLVAAGAQGTKWLGTLGEQLKGVYHAKDIVYHYNGLPPFSEQSFPLGKRVAIVGAGNVMTDIANYCIRHLKVEEVSVIVRRDVSAVKFDRKELSAIFENFDQSAFEAEVERTRTMVEACGIDVDAAKEFMYSAEKRAQAANSTTKLRFEFLSSIKEIHGEQGVTHIEIEDNNLIAKADGRTSARSSGNTRMLDVDSVIYAIGDTVDAQLGLPTNKWGEFEKSAEPQHEINNISYEAFNPITGEAIDGVFLAGWAREASSGLVGTARKDGINCAKAVQQFLATVTATQQHVMVVSTLQNLHATVVTKSEVQQLTAIEKRYAETHKLPGFKFTSNEQMLAQLCGEELAEMLFPQSNVESVSAD